MSALCRVTEELVGLINQTTILEFGVTIAQATVALILLHEDRFSSINQVFMLYEKLSTCDRVSSSEKGGIVTISHKAA